MHLELKPVNVHVSSALICGFDDFIYYWESKKHRKSSSIHEIQKTDYNEQDVTTLYKMDMID